MTSRQVAKQLLDGKTPRVSPHRVVGHALTVLDMLLLVLMALRGACRRRGDLVLENFLLRHQLAVLTRPPRQRRRVRLRRLDKALWVLIRRLRRDWRRHLVFVTPDAVLRWHRAGWRRYWRWRSRGGGGRPRLSPEIRALIARMSRENPLWGSERIRGELLKLGIAVSNRSIRRYRSPGSPRPPSQTWRTFITNHAHAIWAADLCVVQTLTFRTLYVLLFIAHGHRELVHVNVTAQPTAAWVWRQLVEATPWRRRPKHLVRDRDSVYGGDFRARADAPVTSGVPDHPGAAGDPAGLPPGAHADRHGGDPYADDAVTGYWFSVRGLVRTALSSASGR